MSIIQEALKKVQGGATAKIVPQRKAVTGEFDYGAVLRSAKAIDVKKARPSYNGKSIQTIALITAFSSLIVAALIQFPWELQNYAKGDMPALQSAKAGPDIIAESYTTMDMIPTSKSYLQSQSIPPIPKFQGELLPDFRLKGIMQLADGPRAIINDAIVAVGDKVDGATVSQIEKQNVILQMGDSKIKVDMR